MRANLTPHRSPVVVASYTGLVAEEDLFPNLFCSLHDLGILLFFEIPDPLRIPFLGSHQWPLGRTRDTIDYFVHALWRHLYSVAFKDEVTDHLEGPQHGCKTELPRVSTHDPITELIHLTLC